MIAGVDIGGTSTKMGLVLDGELVARTRLNTRGHLDEHAFADAIAGALKELAKSVPSHSLQAVGIGAPNGDQLTGTIDRAPNMPWKGDVPLAKMLQERIGVHCVLGNDANAAALGEWKFGGGRDVQDLLVVTLGTGLGSGIISDGRLILGPYGNAGELGHTIVVIDGRTCTCGRKGCLEAYVSIRGMRQTYAEHADDPALLNEEGVLPIARAALAGEDAARQTFISTARWLSVGLANTVALLVPKRILLVGGIAQSGELLLEPLRANLEKDLLYIHEGKVEVGMGMLTDDVAGVLGAASFVASLDHAGS